MQLGGALTEKMHATVNVGIGIQIFVAHGIKHAQRFLGGGSIVKIDKRTAVYFFGKNREILSYLFYIIHS